MSLSLLQTILTCKVIQTFQKYHCFFVILLIRENSQSLHLFNCLRRIQPYKLQEKCKYVYKGLMTLIPSKWKRTVLFCNLRVCQHVFPRKQKFLKIVVYIMDCIHLKKNEFSKWFTKSIFSFLKDFLQKRYITKK